MGSDMKPAHRRSVPGDPFFTAESPRRLGTYAAPDVAQDMIRACAGHVVQRASINQRHGRLPPPPWIPRPRAAASPAEVGVASGKSQDEPARTLQYHGVPVPSAGWRALLVPPKPETRDPRFNPGCEVRRQAIDEGQEGSKPKGTWRRRNYPWALLVRRVFACDVLACDRCGGRRLRNWMSLSGFALISDYKQAHGGAATFSGHGVFTFDTSQGLYALHRFDCMGSPPEVFHGDFEGNVLMAGHGGPGVYAHMTYDLTEPQVMLSRMEMSQDGPGVRKRAPHHLRPRIDGDPPVDAAQLRGCNSVTSDIHVMRRRCTPQSAEFLSLRPGPVANHCLVPQAEAVSGAAGDREIIPAAVADRSRLACRRSGRVNPNIAGSAFKDGRQGCRT